MWPESMMSTARVLLPYVASIRAPASRASWVMRLMGAESGPTMATIRSQETFEAMIERGEFLEYAQYVDNYYGTSLKVIEEKRSAGVDVLLDIEVQGAAKVCYLYAIQFGRGRGDIVTDSDYRKMTNKINSGIHKYRNVPPSFVLTFQLFLKVLEHLGILK